jgi:dihydroorotase
MATARAARLLGRADELGSLAVGRTADISVLRLEEREWTALDSRGGTLRAPQALVPVLCLRDGHVHEAGALPRP